MRAMRRVCGVWRYKEGEVLGVAHSSPDNLHNASLVPRIREQGLEVVACYRVPSLGSSRLAGSDPS